MYYFVIEYTPLLPASAQPCTRLCAAPARTCTHLDFSKVKPRPGPGPDEWLFELKDLRICYTRQMPGPDATGQVKTIRVWMP